MKANSRRAAAFAVANWLATGEFPAALLPSGPDRAFVQDLVYTTVRRLRPLRKILGELVKRWPKGELEALLYVGAAQILYMPDVPDFAAVNETVDAAKACGNPSVARVVNGVLRNLLRRRAEFEAQLAAAPLEERESYPTEIVRRWRARFGEEGAAALAAWHNRPAETFLARPDGSFTVLERGHRVEDEPGYAEGAFIVQDPATALAVRLMDVRPGETVLDACAAPGGKTVQLAWRGAKVTACEVNPKRRRRLEENLKRLKLEVEVVDSLERLSTLDPQVPNFSKVLVDAPCSNTGVFRRRPDARWSWNTEKQEKLVKLQAEILDAAAAHVTPGGLLVYSTCSNESEENHGQAVAFLRRHPEFEAVAEEESVPHLSGTDGAFAASFRRAAAAGAIPSESAVSRAGASAAGLLLCVALACAARSGLCAAAERWAVVSADGPAACGLYMVSGDAKPDGADAWFDPQSGDLTRFDGRVVRNYLTEKYGIPYRPINPNLIFKTPPVGWMTWYAVKFMASESTVLHNARDFKAKFTGYTDEKPVLWVDWEWFHPRFHDDGVVSDTDMLSPRKDVYPRGLKPVADDLKALGFTPALWVSVFSDVRTNALWKARPEWCLGHTKYNTWSGFICGNPDAPGFCEEFVPEIFARYRDWGYEAYKWDTVPVAYCRFNEFRKAGVKLPSSRELLRKCAAAVRRAVGDNCYVISCSGELDEVNLAAIDILDGGRIGGDIFSWTDFRRWGVDRILSYQPFHNTVFWSDADNLVLRAEFSTLAQARTRVSIYALAGVPITMGDEISALDDARIDLVRRAMPVVPLRPASLRRGGPAPDLLPLRADFARGFGSWQVRGWSNLTTNRTLAANLTVRDAAVWDYWNDRLVSAERGERALTFRVAPGDTALCRVTPLAAEGPTLLSVSRHVTQGGYELKDYKADGTGASGVVRCPGGETVTVTFLLPERARIIRSTSHPYDTDGRILRLRLRSEAREDVPFALTLAGHF